jgi:ribosomal protein S18 acetylase RimI-like enzyme
VCRAGYAASSQKLLSPSDIERQSQLYYTPERVRREILSSDDAPEWQGYVVAVTAANRVIGAAGGGVTGGSVGNVYVLYLNLALRGLGIGSALLEFVTRQQQRMGATEQWVSVTEGNDLGIPFYRALGFVVRERVPYIMGDDEAVEAYPLRMSRALRSGGASGPAAQRTSGPC